MEPSRTYFLEEVIGHNQQPHESRWHLLTCELQQGSSKALVCWQNPIICHFIDRMRFILSSLTKMFIALVAVQHSSRYELCYWKPIVAGHTTEIRVVAGYEKVSMVPSIGLNCFLLGRGMNEMRVPTHSCYTFFVHFSTWDNERTIEFWFILNFTPMYQYFFTFQPVYYFLYIYNWIPPGWNHFLVGLRWKKLNARNN